MFARPRRHLKLPGGETASAVVGNLVCTSAKQRVNLICASGTQALITAFDDDASKECKKEFLRHRIRSIQAVLVDGTTLVVLTSDNGFSVWDASMQTCHFSHTVAGGNADPSVAFHCQGAASLRCVDDEVILCIGSSDGCIRLFQPAESFSFVQVATTETLRAPVLAVEALSNCATEQHRLLVSTSAKAVHLYRAASATAGTWQQRLVVAEPVVAMAHNASFVALGLCDGRVHLLDQDSLTTSFEIVAHSRFLSALHMHPEGGWLLTAAQDSTAAVWALPSNSDGEVDVVTSLLWHNHMVTGACFVPGTRCQLATSAYSTGCIQTWEFDS